MDWTELPEVRIVKDDVLPHMMRTLLDCEYTDRMARKEKFKEEYHRLTTSQQWALGYMLCLMASSRLSRFDPYTGAETDLFSRFRPSFLRLPLRFLGYPGAHNATGIAYGLDPTYFYDEASRLFYTDDGISRDPAFAEKVAAGVERGSCGIKDVRVETVNELRTMEKPLHGPWRCITFRIDEFAEPEITIEGLDIVSAQPVLVVPRSGEFDCMLGEMVSGDPDDCFLLARDSYCMK